MADVGLCTLSQAAQDLLAERQRQVEVEGWTPEHDDQHGDGSMSMAAACYALVGTAVHRAKTFEPQTLWAWTGWAPSWFKPRDRRANLIRAGALILAELERLDREKARTRPDGHPAWLCESCTSPGYCAGSLQGCDKEEIAK